MAAPLRQVLEPVRVTALAPALTRCQAAPAVMVVEQAERAAVLVMVPAAVLAAGQAVLPAAAAASKR